MDEGGVIAAVDPLDEHPRRDADEPVLRLHAAPAARSEPRPAHRDAGRGWRTPRHTALRC